MLIAFPLVKQGLPMMQDVETHLCKEIMSEAGSQDEGSVFPLRAECDLRGRYRSEDPKISMSGGPDAGSSCCKTKTVMLRTMMIGCLKEFSFQFFMSTRKNMSIRRVI